MGLGMGEWGWEWANGVGDGRNGQMGLGMENGDGDGEMGLGMSKWDWGWANGVVNGRMGLRMSELCLPPPKETGRHVVSLLSALACACTIHLSYSCYLFFSIKDPPGLVFFYNRAMLGIYPFHHKTLVTLAFV